MRTTARRRTGRPSKPAGEKATKKSFSFSPEVWEKIERYIPRGERSAIVQAALEREADSRRWSEAAVRMRDYYATDAEVLTWDAMADEPPELPG
jgi:hypothetical protein